MSCQAALARVASIRSSRSADITSTWPIRTIPPTPNWRSSETGSTRIGEDNSLWPARAPTRRLPFVHEVGHFGEAPDRHRRGLHVDAPVHRRALPDNQVLGRDGPHEMASRRQLHPA